MKSLLVATTNKAKLAELMLGLKKLEQKRLKVFSLNNLSITEEPEETGKTFKENSLLKAKFYAKISGLPTLADDGGLIIPALNNEPGVKSRRWLGREATDKELIDYALRRLHPTGEIRIDRTAYLETCLCFYDPKTKKQLCEQEKIKGLIAEKPSGRPTLGYPYRALFIVKEFNKYYDELTDEEHKIINHRLKALKRLVIKIETVLK